MYPKILSSICSSNPHGPQPGVVGVCGRTYLVVTNIHPNLILGLVLLSHKFIRRHASLREIRTTISNSTSRGLTSLLPPRHLLFLLQPLLGGLADSILPPGTQFALFFPSQGTRPLPIAPLLIESGDGTGDAVASSTKAAVMTREYFMLSIEKGVVKLR